MRPEVDGMEAANRLGGKAMRRLHRRFAAAMRRGGMGPAFRSTHADMVNAGMSHDEATDFLVRVLEEVYRAE